MKIGILLTGHAPDELRPTLGDYDTIFADMIAGHGFTVQAWNVVDMEFPPDVHACDGWILTGSKHGAYEDHPFIPPLEDFIRTAYAADVPLVGICFGHQIIAQALGGRVEKFAGGWSVGPQVYDWNGEKVTLNAWHQDQVVERPADATVCASSAFCENAALVYGKKAFTVQAHPEYGAEFLSGLARTRGPGVVPAALLEQVVTNLSTPTDNARLARQIGAFFKERSIPA